jgi:signal transduction histidine kinase
VIETTGVLLLFALSSVLIFSDFFGMHDVTSSITYIFFPPLIWVALRFGLQATTVSILLLSLLAVISTSQGLGPFVTGRLSDSLLYLQSFLGVVGFTSMVLAIVVEQQKRLERRKDEFISMASHELKTPVTSLKIYAQLLQRQFRKEKIKNEIMPKMERQVDKLTKLIADLLDLSKIQVGKLEFRRNAFALDELIAETVEVLQNMTEKHTIVVEGQTRRKVFADRDRIGQVLSNLITNAIKYSPRANKIIISSKVRYGYVIVSIRDFGIGIGSKDQKRLFERFYRVEGASEKTYPGFGIGLYIANEIVRSHGGYLSVESRKGKGSVFSFRLPLAKISEKNLYKNFAAKALRQGN